MACGLPDLTRRGFLRGAGVVAAGGALGPMLSGAALTDALADGDDVEWYKAPCRFCGTGCGVEVGVGGGRIVAVRGDAESPVNRGLLCAKGYSLPSALAGADRLTQPLIRGADGRLAEASWDEALGLVAER